VHARSRRVVFIIDSDDASRVTHETILRTEGYDILSASNGERALTLLREHAPDLVLLGSRTGTISAIKLIQVIKEDRALRQTKVAACAGATENATVVELLKAGAHDVVVTPVAPPHLVKRVAELIGRA
jgi:DNA-binding response OmpR family regulator